MKYFPKYRIYSILGWGLPIVLSYYVSSLPDIHWVFRILLFIVLYPVFFVGIIVIYLIVGKIWNNWKRKSEQSASEGSG